MAHSLRASTLGWLMTALLLAPTAAAETYVVTSTADNGAVGTLRWAIEQANATTGLDTILIAVGSDKTLTLKSVIEAPLPLDITEAVIIDSSASPGLTVTRGLASESFEIDAATTWTDLHLASVGGFLADDRADDGDGVQRLGQPGPVFGDRDARQDCLDRLGRTAVGGTRLGVPGLHLAGGSSQPDQNAGPLLPLELLGAQAQGCQQRGGRETDRLAAGERVVVSDLIPAVDGMLLAPVVDNEAARALIDEAEGRGPVR